MKRGQLLQYFLVNGAWPIRACPKNELFTQVSLHHFLGAYAFLTWKSFIIHRLFAFLHFCSRSDGDFNVQKSPEFRKKFLLTNYFCSRNTHTLNSTHLQQQQLYLWPHLDSDRGTIGRTILQQDPRSRQQTKNAFSSRHDKPNSETT